MARPIGFNKETALQQAIGVFWEKGYSASSVGDLTKAMGISRSSFYNTFTDKHTLYLTALESYLQIELELLNALLKDKPTVEMLKVSLYQLIGILLSTEKGTFTINAMVEMGHKDAEVRALVIRLYDIHKEQFIIYFERMQKNNLVTDRIAASYLAVLFSNTIIGLTMTSKINPVQSVLEEMVDAFLKILEK